jgi:hypothetical protein
LLCVCGVGSSVWWEEEEDGDGWLAVAWRVQGFGATDSHSLARSSYNNKTRLRPVVTAPAMDSEV